MFITRGLLKSAVVLCLVITAGVALAGDADLEEIAGFDLAGMPELVSSVSDVYSLDEALQKGWWQGVEANLHQI